MTPDFRFFVESTNIEGDRSTARFLSARSAYFWAARLKEEGTEWKATKKTTSGNIVEVTLSELKKEAGPCSTPKKKPRFF